MKSDATRKVDAGRRAFLRGSFLTDRAGPNPRPGLAALNRDACVAWDGVVCMSCRFACGDGAIALDGRSRPHVKADSCTGCEACVSVCPTGAIIVPS